MRCLPFLLVLTVACDRVPTGDVDDTDDASVDTDTDDTDPDTTPADDTDGADTDDTVDTDPTTVDPDVTGCAPLPAATSGLCDVDAGTNGALLVRGVVLAPDTTYDGGSVLLDASGEITCVGCDCDQERAAVEATVVTCPDGVISPGLVNPHDHLTFSEGPPLPPSDRRYDHRHGWRSAVSTPSNFHGTGSTQPGNRWVEVRHLVSGTTTVVGSGYARGMVRNPDDGDLLAPGMPEVTNETFPLDDGNERFQADCGWDYKRAERELALAPAYLPHVAEGIDAYAADEFFCQSRSTDGGQDAVEANVAHVHGIGLDAADYFDMARSGTALVWSPRSNISLYGHTANVRLLATLGGTLALGTDWTYTGSANMLRELACADELNKERYDGFFSDADLWRMATSGAASALGAEAAVGSLAPGLVGDLAVFDGRDHRGHRAVIAAGSEDVLLVLRAGVPLFGEADTLAELGAACEEVRVCSYPRRVCAGAEFGVPFGQLQAQVPGAYPVFFCDDAPPDEPTCEPSRPGEFTGARTADDPDGDGIPSAEDLCPAVFDPVRPIDGGAQPDADQDGLGDACDASPLPPDLDGDGVANLLDVCPFDDDDQADADADGKGDACDACPDEANPLTACASLTLTTIPDARALPANTAVTVEGVVTGIGSQGFSLQDPTVADGRNAGIYVFVGARPSVSVGERVQVDGRTGVYFGESQISEDATRSLGTTTPIAPVALTVAEAATEPYEGVLVRLTDGAVTNAAYSCAVDASSCADPGLWEVGGPGGVVVFDRFYGGTAWAGRVGELPVTGVMTFRFERRRIMPRSDADFGP